MLDKKKIIGIALNNMEFKTQAMIRRYFGSNRYYYGYSYGYGNPKVNPEPGFWGRFDRKTKDVKTANGKARPAGEKGRSIRLLFYLKYRQVMCTR